MIDNIQTILQLSGTALTIASSFGLGVYSQLKKEVEERVVELPQDYICKEHELNIGYGCKYSNVMPESMEYCTPVIINMKRTPHMLVCGLAQQGKSSMVEFALRNKRVILMNAFENDFQSLQECLRINSLEYIEEVLEKLVNTKNNCEVTYLVIDELLSLVLNKRSKKVQDLIMDLLANATHKNIYIIGITQTSEKDILKFKHLFNTRVCFRMLDDSSIKTCLGYTPDDPYLNKREFLYVSDTKGKGFTYDL